MSTISTVGTTNAWPEPIGSGHAHGSRRAERIFEKTDSNGDGSVDSTELQSMLDDIAKKTGGSAASAADTMSKLDTDGNGTLSKDELAAGMKDLMPPPASTMAFAQRSSGMEGPPPPSSDNGASASGNTAGSSSGSDDPSSSAGSQEDSTAAALTALINRVLKQYEANTASTANITTEQPLSVTA